MGVKSTVTLTHTEAVARYVELRLKLKAQSRKYEAKAIRMSEQQLENEIEFLNDRLNGGEGYENYQIVDS